MARDAPVHVRRHGTDGPEVVVLHGGPGAPGSAGSLARALATRCRAFEPWQRRADDRPLTVARHVADLARVAPAEAAIVGWSFGAMLALSYAAAHPHRVRTLVLVACGTYAESDRAELRRLFDARLGPAGREEMARLRERLAGERDPARRDAIVAHLGARAMRAQSVDPLPDDEAPPPDARGHEETWADVLRLQAEGVEPAAFRAVRAPVLLIHGADDPHPGARTRDTLRPHVAALEYVELPECGHTPWLERRARAAFLDAVFARVLPSSDT